MKIQKPRETSVLYCYLEDSKQKPSVGKYTKWKKYQLENINISSRFKPASYRVDINSATTELPDNVTIRSNTTYLNKTHFYVTLARPNLINSPATQYQGAAIFPQK